jgi:prolyl-tRNA editing enzyme YbaK/EbsC (Cys-tRNA(Pro) deacylase)
VIDPQLTGLARVRAAIVALGLDGRIVSPGLPMPTVLLAAAAVGVSVDQIIKTVVFMTPDRRPVIAIANGLRRVDHQLLAQFSGEPTVRLATTEFVLEQTGYPAGGVSPIGIRSVNASVIIDQAVTEQVRVFGGAGSEADLIEVSVTDLLRATGGHVRLITRADSP